MVLRGSLVIVGSKISLYPGVDKLFLFQDWLKIFIVEVPWICAFSHTEFLFNAIGHKGSERSKWNAFLNDSVET